MSDTIRRRLAATTRAILLVTVLASCGWPGSGPGSQTVEADLEARIGPDTPLSQALRLLRAELDSALESGLDDDGLRHLDRAEVVSDRLLETRLPFAWISADSYSLEARLRQIQSLVDRAVSLQAGGARREDISAQIQQLNEALEGLRSDLAAGGSIAPPPVDQLLIRLDTARR